ncbi:hypothetical protein [Thiocystis minor]|uniref:hypothetical protein n=1 Tax=Thiocystis minor TaxID=61597 RepID=UPI0019113645|nr:hypothetical protein [Thiocystis minor]
MKPILAIVLLTALPLAAPFPAQARIDKASPAAKLCVTKMAQETGEPKSEVAIYDMMSSEAATVVFMTVGSKSGAWKCFVTPQGKFDGLERVEDESTAPMHGGSKPSGGVPFFNGTCPGDIEVHADKGGPVYLNGKEAKLKKINKEYYEATGAGITLSIAIDPDDSVTLSYTGKHGANGICQVDD